MWRLSVGAIVLARAAFPHAETFSGTLDPASNTALTYWDQSLNSYRPPVTGQDDYDRAFNIAVHPFSISAPGPATFASKGYGLGGFDSVLSVFQGAGTSAVYLHHGYSSFFPGDFSFDLNLGAGDYLLAVTMFGSQPCATGLCSGPLAGTFGDGFTNLVNFDPFQLDPLFYRVDITAPVPEPSTAIVPAVFLAAVLCRRAVRCKAERL